MGQTYTYRASNGVSYYRVFTKIKKGNAEEYVWEDGFVKTSSVIPQPINVQEYVYYRRKLISLIKGKCVVFNDEDTDSSAEEKSNIEKEKWKEVQSKQIHATFSFVPDNQKSVDQFKAITTHYLNVIELVKESMSFLIIKEALWNDLTERLLNMAVSLLSYPWEQLDDPFKISDAWINKNMKETYMNVYEKVFGFKGNKSWDAFVTQLSVYCPRNTDYHIEVNTKTPIGVFGKYGKKNQIHVEVFSEKELIGNNEKDDEFEYKQINIQNNEKCFNKKEIVKLFSDAKIFDQIYFSFLKENYIRPVELGSFYKEKQGVLRHIIINKFNTLEEKDEQWFKSLYTNAIGFFESNEDNKEVLYRTNPEAFLSDKVKKELGFKNDEKSWFYHPAQLVVWLNEQQKKMT